MTASCEEAFRFYEIHLGGRVSGIVRHGEIGNPNVPKDWALKVTHARIEIGGTVLMGADIPGAEPMRSAYLTLSVDSEDEAEPFANRFAMLRDRFGTSWMLLHQPEAPR